MNEKEEIQRMKKKKHSERKRRNTKNEKEEIQRIKKKKYRE